MKQSRQMRIALLAGMLSLALCITVLAGTTFAWFEDSSANTGNTVQSGGIQASFSLGDAEKETPLTDETTVLNTTVWEPGAEETVKFQIKGEQDSLPFTYGIWLKSDTFQAPLARYLEVYLVKAGDAENDSSEQLLGTVDRLINTQVATGNLQADGVTTVTLKIKMKDDAPFSLTKEGTEMSLWFDLRADQQRAGVTTFDELKSQLESGGCAALGGNITFAPTATESAGEESFVPQIVVSQNAQLDLLQWKMQLANGESESTCTPALISVQENASLTIEGQYDTEKQAGGSVEVESVGYGIVVNGGQLTINGGRYSGQGTAVFVQSGTAMINDGFFEKSGDNPPVLCGEDGTLIIRGGTFVNFDPSKVSTDSSQPDVSYVANGYTVKQESKGEDTWYTVVPEGSGETNDQEADKTEG